MIWKFACDLRVSVTTYHKICKSRIIPESLKWIVHLIRFNLPTHLSILITFSYFTVFIQFLFLYFYKTINYLWCKFHQFWLLVACSLVVFASCLLCYLGFLVRIRYLWWPRTWSRSSGTSWASNKQPKTMKLIPKVVNRFYKNKGTRLAWKQWSMQKFIRV